MRPYRGLCDLYHDLALGGGEVLALLLAFGLFNDPFGPTVLAEIVLYEEPEVSTGLELQSA